MRLRDIRVGEDYAVGFGSYQRRERTIEVGVHGVERVGHDRKKSRRADFVRVDRHRRIPSKLFLCLWRERGAHAERAKRLRGAAPDLLAAAKHAAMEWRLHGQLTDSCRVLEAAIAHAEDR